MREIISKIIKTIFIFSFTVVANLIIVFLVVIPSPTEFSSYALLSFILIVDAIMLTVEIMPFCKFKNKPKTISKPLVFWLLIVFYCGFIASGLLTDAYFSAMESVKTLVLVFACIFGAIALGAAAVLLYQLIAYFRVVFCLKYGKETTGEFIGFGKMLEFTYGKPQTYSYRAIFKYGVIFRYSADGKEKTQKSKIVFTEKEVKALQKAETFKIRYTKRIAVIAETVEPDENNAGKNENTQNQ